MGEFKTIGEMLKARYVTDFITEMARLGATREEVVKSATKIVSVTIGDDIKDSPFKDNEDLLETWVKGQIEEALDDVFNQKETPDGNDVG